MSSPSERARGRRSLTWWDPRLEPPLGAAGSLGSTGCACSSRPPRRATWGHFRSRLGPARDGTEVSADGRGVTAADGRGVAGHFGTLSIQFGSCAGAGRADGRGVSAGGRGVTAADGRGVRADDTTGRPTRMMTWLMWKKEKLTQWFVEGGEVDAT
eukprot:8666202-Pyramimonas_sp.AAC.1